jgi:hypothetical protein
MEVLAIEGDVGAADRETAVHMVGVSVYGMPATLSYAKVDAASRTWTPM